MSPLDAARLMNGWHPVYCAGISRKVRDGVTGWERWLCSWCAAETLKGYHKEIQHEDDCPWLAFPQIAEILEKAAEREADSCGPCWRVAHSGIGTYPWTCVNGHTLYFGAGTLSARNRMPPEMRNLAPQQ